MQSLYRLFFLLLFCFCSNGLNAQIAIEWQRSLGGSGGDNAYHVQQTSDGGYVVAGMTNSNDGDVTGNHGGYDYWIIKIDDNGNLLWQKALGGTDFESAQSVQQTSDGGYVVAGMTNSNDGDVTGNHGGLDYWVVKIDNIGNIQWQKCLGGSGDDRANDVEQTSDGGYVVAGWTNSNDGDLTLNLGLWDYWVVKLDFNGNIQWQKSLGGSGTDVANDVQQTSDGGYVVAGYSSSNDGDVTGQHGLLDYWIVKLDNAGNIQWQKCFGGMNFEKANSIQQTSDGGYVVAGWSESNNGDVTGNHGGYDYWIIKIDDNGNLLWQKSLGGDTNDEASFIYQTTDGGYVVAGWSQSNNGDVTGNHGGDDYWIVKIDDNGDLQWQKCLGGTDFDQAWAVQQTSNGGYVVAGRSESNDGDVTGNHDYFDYWIVKLSPFVGIEETNNNNMSTLFPNPFSTTTTLSFGKHVHGATLTLYNLIGERVAEESNIYGESFHFNRGTLQSGVYMYEVKEKDFVLGRGKAVAY